MAGASYSITAAGVEDIHDRLNVLLKKGTELKPIFQQIGEILLVGHDERFRTQVSPDGTPWAPLSEKYKAKKKKNKDLILTLDGYLSGTLSYVATNADLFFGTPLIYGAIQQLGGTAGMAPGPAAIPARDWLGVSNDDRDEIFDMLGDYLSQV